MGNPAFLMDTKEERLKELQYAESQDAHAIMALRGGVGAIELWEDYTPVSNSQKFMPLIGYSDITILHFKRFFSENIIGIHGPNLCDIFNNNQEIILALKNIINKKISFF